jgi:hypothetical protein
LVFVRRETPELYDEAERLVKVLSERNIIKAQLIDPGTDDLEHLLLVAKYGVVERCVVVLVDDSGLRGRLTELPRPEELRAVLMRILQSPTPSA